MFITFYAMLSDHGGNKISYQLTTIPLVSMKKHFNKLRFRVPNTTSFLTIGPLGPTISEGFTLNGLGGHLGHVTHKAAKKLSFLHIWGLRTKFGFNWPSGLEDEDV